MMNPRVYFAAHAPDVPDWFDPERDRPMPLALFPLGALATISAYLELPDEQRAELRAWVDDGTWDLDDPHLAQIGAEAMRIAERNKQEIEAESARRHLARMVAWRWHYADAMAKAMVGALG